MRARFLAPLRQVPRVTEVGGRDGRARPLPPTHSSPPALYALVSLPGRTHPGYGVRMGRFIVVGDLMTDVVARVMGPITLGTDTPTRVDSYGGGSAANVAAWLGRQGE